MSKRDAWHPSIDNYDKQDIRAIQTLVLYAQGAEHPWEPGQEPPIPSPSDVKRALDWIIWKAAGTYEETFVPGCPDITQHLQGRRSVGLAITKLMRLKPEVLDQPDRT